MFTLKAIPNWLLIVASTLLPIAVLYKFGEDAMLFLLALLGVLLGYIVYLKNLQKALFIGLIATLFFSIELPLLGGSALSLPAEPLAMLLAMATLISILFNLKQAGAWVKEPLFWSVLFLIITWVLSTLFSGMFEVSAKYVFINLVFITVGFFAFPLLWQAANFSLKSVLKLLAIPTLFFCAYAVFNLLPHRFNPGAAALIGFPFFKDHTVFSATFSLFVPLFLLWRTFKTSTQKTDWLFPAVGVALLFALFISSSRAAWLAVLIAAVFYGFVRLGGGLKMLGIGFVMFILSLWFFADAIEEKLFINQYTSTETAGGLQDQALSVTNINSDVSNMERLNRWKSAIAMGLDKPIFGFGPGTYQFKYFPYQRDADKTYISVDSPFNTIVGRGGSAHSEYLLLFSESGFAGMLAWIALQIALLFSFFKIWNGNLKKRDKNLALATYLGVLTYTVHSLFNNYLNSAQFGLSWWMLVGALLYLAMKNKKHVA